MCLYPKLIKNPKYLPNIKNKGNPPELTDERIKYVPVGCGKCIECLRKKKREWQVRLNEEIRDYPDAYFVTLTFSDESLEKLTAETNNLECNATATLAVRRFLERHRKKYKVSAKHWLITELGHKNTERIHLHGLIWGIKGETKKDKEKELESLWSYGQIYIGDFVNTKTINYIIKYVTKLDNDHKGYTPIILTSKGIGKNYMNRHDATKNTYKGANTNENYRLPNGNKTQLPMYYRNKIYTEEEREKLWIQKIEKGIRWIDGIAYPFKTIEDLKVFNEILKTAQRDNENLGYGSDQWIEKDYNVTSKKLNLKEYKNKKLIRKIKHQKKMTQIIYDNIQPLF